MHLAGILKHSILGCFGDSFVFSDEEYLEVIYVSIINIGSKLKDEENFTWEVIEIYDNGDYYCECEDLMADTIILPCELKLYNIA